MLAVVFCLVASATVLAIGYIGLHRLDARIEALIDEDDRRHGE